MTTTQIKRSIIAAGIALTLSLSSACSVTTTYSPVSANPSFLSVERDEAPVREHVQKTPAKSAEWIHNNWHLSHTDITKADHDPAR